MTTQELVQELTTKRNKLVAIQREHHATMQAILTRGGSVSEMVAQLRKNSQEIEALKGEK